MFELIFLRLCLISNFGQVSITKLQNDKNLFLANQEKHRETEQSNDVLSSTDGRCIYGTLFEL